MPHALLKTALSIGLITALLQTVDGVPVEPLRIILCSSIVFNLGAATSAVVCIFILSHFTTKARILAATEEGLPRRFLLNDVIHLEYLQEDREREILRKFGMPLTWFIASTLMITCFMLGAICMFIGFGVWVWCQGSQSVGMVLTAMLGVIGGILVLVLVLFTVGM